MPSDFTMCPGHGCPLHATCYRFRAIPAGRQDWLTKPPFDFGRGDCDWFQPLPTVSPKDIRSRAYAIWQAAGETEGHAARHWLQAESELSEELASRLRPLPDLDARDDP